MRKTNEAQLPLIELPSTDRVSTTSRRSSRRSPKMPPALIAKHCNELLAELERVTSGRSPFERSWARAHSLESAPSRDDARAVQLAQLFTAIEGAHLGSATDGADDRASTGARSVA